MYLRIGSRNYQNRTLYAAEGHTHDAPKIRGSALIHVVTISSVDKQSVEFIHQNLSSSLFLPVSHTLVCSVVTIHSECSLWDLTFGWPVISRRSMKFIGINTGNKVQGWPDGRLNENEPHCCAVVGGNGKNIIYSNSY